MPALLRATELAPSNAALFLRLGLRSELQGDLALAERSLLQAARLSRLYQPRYSLAQFYFRRNNAGEFFRWTHAALESSYGDVRPLLVLWWKIQPDPWVFAAAGRCQRQQVERQFLAFLLRRQETAAAASVAAHLAENARPEDLDELLAYCDEVLHRGDPERALSVWNVLCGRKILPFDALHTSEAPITNGSFHREPSGRGFDWRIEPVAGIETRVANGEWRTTFSGRQPESCVIAWQYAPLKPGAKYRVRADAAPIDANSAGGLSWVILDRPVPRIALIYQRPPGTVRTTGTVAMRNLRLELDQ